MTPSELIAEAAYWRRERGPSEGSGWDSVSMIRSGRGWPDWLDDLWPTLPGTDDEREARLARARTLVVDLADALEASRRECARLTGDVVTLRRELRQVEDDFDRFTELDDDDRRDPDDVAIDVESVEYRPVIDVTTDAL